MKEFNYEQELAELKEKVQDLLNEIEELEKGNKAKKEQKIREDYAKGMEQLRLYFDEAKKAGISKYEALTLLSIYAPKQ